MGFDAGRATWGCCGHWVNEAASVVSVTSHDLHMLLPHTAVLPLRNPPLGGDTIQQHPGTWLTTGDLSHPQCLLVEYGDKPGMGLMESDGVSKIGHL